MEKKSVSEEELKQLIKSAPEFKDFRRIMAEMLLRLAKRSLLQEENKNK